VRGIQGKFCIEIGYLEGERLGEGEERAIGVKVREGRLPSFTVVYRAWHIQRQRQI
jgi:hypothetical protein